MYGADTYDVGDNANDRETTFKIQVQSCIFQLSLYQQKSM